MTDPGDGSSGKANILLVDDHDANLLALEAVLDDLGENLVQARSGEEALRRLLDDEFAVILLDVQMAGLDGFETAGRVRRRERSRHTPIIFLTAHDADRSTVERAYALGAVDFLVKPFVPTVLRAKVAVFIDLFRKTRQVEQQQEQIRRAERRDLERRLLGEATRFSTTLSSIGDGVVTADERGRVTFLNPVAEALTGWPWREAEGQPIDRVLRTIDEETRAPVENLAARALRDGRAVRPADHTVLLNRGGGERAVEDSAAPLRDDGGAVVGVVLVLRDVSGRREAERALREHARMAALRADTAVTFARGDELVAGLQGCAAALVEHLGVAFARIWTLSEGGDVLELQASAGLYTHLDGGHSRVRVGEYKIGRIAEQRRPHLTNEVADDPWISDPAWARREGMVAFAGYPLLVEGRLAGVMAMFSRRPLSARVMGDLAPVADGVAQYVERRRSVEALRRAHEQLEARVRQRTADLAATNEALRLEVAERKEAEERAQAFAAELQRSNRELEQFASVASHDLQEPLRKIQAFGDRLQARCGGGLGEQGREYLDRMRAAATRMRNLIDDLLAFSRVTTKARPFVPVDLTAEARQVVSDLEGRILHTGGRVEVGPLPSVHADPSQMRQLLQNLIGNGLKFHRPGEPPVVRVRGHLVPGRGGAGAGCEITVEDDGIGFEEQYLDRIFLLFQRLHPRNEFEGTGIGLAICRKIVDRHGGTITARSRPGCGATFVVTLPLEPPPPVSGEAHTGAR